MGTRMRRCYIVQAVLTVLLALIPVWGCAQDIVALRHVVQRGETMEMLADRYRLSKDMLADMNLGIDTFYTGMEVVVPIDKKYMWLRSEDDGEVVLDDVAGYFSEYREASRIFNSGDYGKADRLFERTIRNHGKYLPCEEAYFGRAMCDYNRKKWSSAVDGFAKVIGIDGCPDDLREQCRSLMADAEQRREARRQRIAGILGSVVQTAVEVGTAYMAASQAVAAQPGYGGMSAPQGVSLGSMSNAEFTNYVNSNLFQIANYSVMQVEQQWRQEEAQVKSAFVSSYRQMHGKDPSAEEVQAAYNAHMQSKADAYRTVQQADSGLYDRQLGMDGGTSTRTGSSTKRCAKLSATDIAHCGGDGRCPKCNGNKKYYDDTLGGAHWVDPCGVCGGSGKCPSCHGTGE